MKYIFPIVLTLALIGIVVAFRPNAGESRVPHIETVIGCAPPGADPTAGDNGKFINPLPGLGKHTYTISAQNDSTQFYFNQGINFYYSYHLREALASFKEAARFDSSAAMVYWGQALSMGPYYNVYAYKMKSGVPTALASMTRHRDNASPEDIDAVMLEHKWDFYTPDRVPKPWTPALVSLCETILKADPHHPAALHYYIHLTEASADPSVALAGAEVLKDDMSGVSHMVHMATHMYQRNGLFLKGVTVNEDANAAILLRNDRRNVSQGYAHLSSRKG